MSCRNLFSFGGRWNERINDMLVTEKGNALLAGTFYEEIELGSEKYVTEGLNDGFVVKLNEAGDEIYDSFQLGTSGEDRIDVLNSYSKKSEFEKTNRVESAVKDTKLFKGRYFGHRRKERAFKTYVDRKTEEMNAQGQVYDYTEDPNIRLADGRLFCSKDQSNKWKYFKER